MVCLLCMYICMLLMYVIVYVSHVVSFVYAIGCYVGMVCTTEFMTSYYDLVIKL